MTFFEIGKIVKTCGLRGRLKAVSYLDADDILPTLEEIFIRKDQGDTQSLRLRGIRTRGKTFFLDIEGVEDVETAGALVGSEVLIPSEKLKKLSEDEYYWRDIIGLTVVTEDGHVLGKIESVFPTGSNDVYVCTGGEREILLPGITDVIREIDTARGRMVVRLLEGL
ncbi:MAG: 16S rRNA processing protein RimM [Deltaproteobacteria bacterium]|nr:16S rRNA processing protein RimM [Deltaproteobacteria bacterium]